MSRHFTLLQIALFIFGVIFCLVYPLAIIWPAGWTWHMGAPASSHYFMMIVGVYAVLGIFLIRAAASPAQNGSLIWFTVWSSLVHAVIMAVQALNDPMQHGHMLGDVPALLIVTIVLGGLMMRERRRPA